MIDWRSRSMFDLVKLIATALQYDVTAAGVVADRQLLLNGGTKPMSLNTRLDALKERHASLEMRISDEDHRPSPDSQSLTRLKLEKLRLKEEMERLRSNGN